VAFESLWRITTWGLLERGRQLRDVLLRVRNGLPSRGVSR